MDKKSPIVLDLRAIKPDETVTQWVYQSLRTGVMQGSIRPGRALTIRELANLLSVSPTPVRSALRQLSSENALVILDNRRVQVPSMTVTRYDELCETRIAIETSAAVRALPYIDQQKIQQLIEIDEKIDQAYAANDIQQVIVANQSFHRTLYSTNPHQVVMPFIESIWLQLGPFLHYISDSLHQYYQQDRHAEAIDAIKKNDALALQLAISADIRDASAFTKIPDLAYRIFNE